MRLTNRQAHVLANLDQVEPLAYKVQVRAPIQRYQLDSDECTAQINGLVVRGYIQESGHCVRRTSQSPKYVTRQPASPEMIKLIRDTLVGDDMGTRRSNKPT